MQPLIPLAHGALGNLDEIAALVMAGVLAFILLAPMILKAFRKEDDSPAEIPPEKSEGEDHSPLT